MKHKKILIILILLSLAVVYFLYSQDFFNYGIIEIKARDVSGFDGKLNLTLKEVDVYNGTGWVNLFRDKNFVLTDVYNLIGRGRVRMGTYDQIKLVFSEADVIERVNEFDVTRNALLENDEVTLPLNLNVEPLKTSEINLNFYVKQSLFKVGEEETYVVSPVVAVEGGESSGSVGGGSIEEDFVCENLTAYGGCMILCNQNILFDCKVDCIRSSGVYCEVGKCEEGLEVVKECIISCADKEDYKSCKANCRLKC